MTPPSAAAAPAAPPRRTRSAAARKQAGARHRAPRSLPRPSRRISGPARGRAAGPPRSRSDAGAALLRDPLAPLRRLTPRSLLQRAASAASVRSLQRLLAGRLGIALVAFALIGIVTLQLGLLKLNGGIGRALEHEALLQRENAALSIENSELAAGDRVELRAAQIGMQYVPPGALKPLVARPGADAFHAAAALRSPPLPDAQRRRERNRQRRSDLDGRRLNPPAVPHPPRPRRANRPRAHPPRASRPPKRPPAPRAHRLRRAPRRRGPKRGLRARVGILGRPRGQRPRGSGIGRWNRHPERAPRDNRWRSTSGASA